MRALTAEQMRDADARGQERLSDVALMRAAGERLREAIAAHMPAGGPIVAFAALALVEPARARIIYALEAKTPSAATSSSRPRSPT